MRLVLLLVLVLPPATRTYAQPHPDSTRAVRLEWFREARFGVFIHWGIYAVDGIDESWSFFNGYISYDDYMRQLDGFTAAEYDPAEWAELIASSGARYAVLTTRHHDGVALWDTGADGLSVVRDTPAGRDLVGPFAAALRARGLKVGLYYSHSDWSHPDYDVFTSSETRYEDDPVRFSRFLDYHRRQLRELATRYRPDLFWFDGDWEHDANTWRFRDLRDSLFSWTPDVVLNSRIGPYGDYATPEQGVPIVPPDGPWELCLTMNDTWGFQEHDANYKTANQLIRIFADVIGMGGNLLLNIGPRADGTIPGEERDVLAAFGRWTRRHAEAVYGTRAGLPPGHFFGPSTMSADGRTLYLFLSHRPNGPIVVKGLKNRVQRVRIVGNGTRPSWRVVGKQYWSEVPGLLYVDVPVEEQDPDVTVVALLLDGPLDVYRERRE